MIVFSVKNGVRKVCERVAAAVVGKSKTKKGRKEFRDSQTEHPALRKKRKEKRVKKKSKKSHKSQQQQLIT